MHSFILAATKQPTKYTHVTVENLKILSVSHAQLRAPQQRESLKGVWLLTLSSGAKASNCVLSS